MSPHWNFRACFAELIYAPTSSNNALQPFVMSFKRTCMRVKRRMRKPAACLTP